jgi:hypothetical protein
VAEAAELTKVRARLRPEGLDVAERGRVEGVGGVEGEQLEAGRAEVDAVDRPVPEAGHAEGAAVAHALAEHLPGVAGVAAVVPRHERHLLEVVRLLAADAVGRQADPALRVPAAELHAV